MRTKQDKPSRGAAGRIAEARLQRLSHQNEKLKLEVQRLKGEVGPIEEFKQTVLKANAVVRQQLLALPFRLGDQLAYTTDPRECGKLLTEAITQSLNDLAYSREIPPDTCPTCGVKLSGGREEEEK